MVFVKPAVCAERINTLISDVSQQFVFGSIVLMCDDTKHFTWFTFIRSSVDTWAEDATHGW